MIQVSPYGSCSKFMGEEDLLDNVMKLSNLSAEREVQFCRLFNSIPMKEVELRPESARFAKTL